MVRRFASCLGLLGFAASITCGLAAGNPVDTILIRALWAMAAFVIMGSLAGWMALVVVNEHVRLREEQLLPTQADRQAQEQPASADQTTQQSPETSGSRPTGTPSQAA